MAWLTALWGDVKMSSGSGEIPDLCQGEKGFQMTDPYKLLIIYIVHVKYKYYEFYY